MEEITALDPESESGMSLDLAELDGSVIAEVRPFTMTPPESNCLYHCLPPSEPLTQTVPENHVRTARTNICFPTILIGESKYNRTRRYDTGSCDFMDRGMNRGWHSRIR